jgi:hypothetical protein
VTFVFGSCRRLRACQTWETKQGENYWATHTDQVKNVKLGHCLERRHQHQTQIDVDLRKKCIRDCSGQHQSNSNQVNMAQELSMVAGVST